MFRVLGRDYLLILNKQLPPALPEEVFPALIETKNRLSEPGA